MLMRMLKLIRILKVVRLLRVVKLKRLMYMIEERIITDTLNALLEASKVFIGMMIMSHWMACGFYYIADYESTDTPTNWVTVSGIMNEPLFHQYVHSLYFALSTLTTMGYGDISP